MDQDKIIEKKIDQVMDVITIVEPEKKKSLRNYLIIFFDVLFLILLIYILPYEPKINKAIALLFFVAVLWLTEAVHVTTTALFVPVLAVLLGLIGTQSALSSFADPTIFLFLGGFALAGGLHVQKLDKLIANRIMHLAKGRLSYTALFLFVATAFLSMWISNTATVAMMLPLMIGVLSQLDRVKYKSTYTFVLLGIAYSASIGGMGTIVGSPPNAIVASQLHISFAEWMRYGIVMVLVFLPLMIAVLYFILKPDLKHRFVIEPREAKMSNDQYIMLGIFIFIASCWIFSRPLSQLLGEWSGFGGKIGDFDSIIALFAILLICVSQVSRWKELRSSIEWGVLLLFGGGLTLSFVLKDSGASKVMADFVVAFIEGGHFYVIGLVVAFFILFVTEFTSNTASAALLVPIFISISEELGLEPLGLALIIGFGASCAFMLPVATPPNAIVYATGEVKQRDMMKVGLVLNIFSALLIATISYVFWFKMR